VVKIRIVVSWVDHEGAVCSSETSVSTDQIVRWHNPAEKAFAAATYDTSPRQQNVADIILDSVTLSLRTLITLPLRLPL
jgi:hypothetical protein